MKIMIKIGAIIWAIILGSISIGFDFKIFIDVPSISFVGGLTLAGIVFAYGLNEPIEIIKNTFTGKLIEDESEYLRYVGFYNFTSRVSIALGLIGTILGIILMLSNLTDMSSLRPSSAIAIMTILYGLVLSEVIIQPMKYSINYKK